MSTLFTSDTHFSHANIIRYCNRPFTDADHMDTVMVDRWNEVVKQGDTVWHLGDFSMRNSEIATRIRQRLNGKINLIWGNHDSNQVRNLPIWASSQPYAEINLDGSKLVLLHYAMKVWNRSHHGAIHLYGHSHNMLPADSGSCDVGVDAWDFRPVTLAQIKARLAKAPPRVIVDHHVSQVVTDRLRSLERREEDDECHQREITE
jgi:calcineurin-like phosphoesterase family protein